MKKYLQDHRKRAKRTTWSGIKQNAVSCSKNLLELNTAADTFIHYQLSLQTLPTHEECVAPNQFFFPFCGIPPCLTPSLIKLASHYLYSDFPSQSKLI